ncbi:hypothetical protein BT63DRAFT_357497, partial [Microthyrium microscopicum]
LFPFADISVRKDGKFRLKFTLINIAGLGPQKFWDGQQRDKNPVPVSCFSAVFEVYTAKKFPGMMKSTELTRALNAQGVKLPMRK